MAAIAIRDLEVCEVLNNKTLANVFGGNDFGYSANNVPARGILQSRVVRKAILGIYTNKDTGRLERKIQDVVLQIEEKAGNIASEPVLF